MGEDSDYLADIMKTLWKILEEMYSMNSKLDKIMENMERNERP